MATTSVCPEDDDQRSAARQVVAIQYGQKAAVDMQDGEEDADRACSFKATPIGVNYDGSIRGDLGVILRLGWPNSVNMFVTFLPGLAMLSFLGSEADHSAAAGMGFMFANVSGLSLIIGAGSGAQPLISQAFGAGNLARCGELLQRQLAIHVVLVLAIGALWLRTEDILLAVQQPPHIAALTARFVYWRIPALPFYAAVQDLNVFLLSQRVMVTPMAISVFANVVNVASFPVLIGHIGFDGAAFAITLANVLQAALLGLATRWALPCVDAWPQWRLRVAFSGWAEILKMSLPSAVLMLCEWWGWEVNLFFAGLLCDSASGGDCLELDVFPVVSNTMVIGFMVHIGFSMAAATHVGNALGAGDHLTARRTSYVTLVLVAAIAGVVSLLLVVMRWRWGQLFFDSLEALDLAARVLPWIAAYIFLDALGPGALVNLLRSMGVVRLPAFINFLSFYVVGIPCGLWLTFGRQRESWGIIGLWAGLVLAMLTMVLSLLAFLMCCIDWRRLAEESQTRAHAETVDGQHETALEKSPIRKPKRALANISGKPANKKSSYARVSSDDARAATSPKTAEDHDLEALCRVQQLPGQMEVSEKSAPTAD